MQILARPLPWLFALFFKRSILPAHTAVATTTTSSTLPPIERSTILSERELADLRSLLPSVREAGHSRNAIRLLDTALRVSPQLSSLPLQKLVDRLCLLPDMSASMALLSAFRMHPRRPSPLPFCAMILSSYFRRRQLLAAAKVFAWLCRADSPCRPDMEIYRITIRGFCERGRAFEGVRVAREMLRDGFVPTVEHRILLCQVLLKEARVKDALDLDSALRIIGEEDGVHDHGINEIAELLDGMIKNWKK